MKKWTSEFDRKRLAAEKLSLKERYPGARLEEQGDQAVVYYTVVVLGRELPVKVTFPGAYPAIPPNVHPVDPLPSETQHVYPDGRICVLHPRNPAWNSTLTVPSILTASHRWLQAYLCWQYNGIWPVPEDGGY